MKTLATVCNSYYGVKTDMRKNANLWLLVAALVLFIAGCAITVAPLWKVDIELVKLPF